MCCLGVSQESKQQQKTFKRCGDAFHTPFSEIAAVGGEGCSLRATMLTLYHSGDCETVVFIG